MDDDGELDSTLTRRDALAAGAAGMVAASLPNPLCAAVPARAIPDASVALHVNGVAHRLIVDPRATLLDVLRERIGLFGAKKGCGHGQSGGRPGDLAGGRVV